MSHISGSSSDARTATSLSGRTIGLVGLDRSAPAVLDRLVGAGARVRVWHDQIEWASDLADRRAGVRPVPTPRDASDGANLVFVCFDNEETLDAAVFDPFENQYGVLHGLEMGTVTVDLGRTSIDRTRRCARRLEDVGCHWLDGPLLADAGDMLMVGGNDGAVALAQPVLRLLAGEVRHVGAVGCGQAAATVAGMAAGQILSALAEAVALGRAAGLEAEVLDHPVRAVLANPALWDEAARRMVEYRYRPGRPVRDTRAAMRAAARLAEELDLDLPVLTASLSAWDAVADGGAGDLDQAAILLAVDPTRDSEGDDDG